MIYTRQSIKGVMSAPHHLAADAGAQILKQGGTAIEAMVAAAATIAVVYPHMNSIGGDGFWLISEPGQPVRAIDACGPAASLATIGFYKEQDLEKIPTRGPNAALTVAGTISGWSEALKISNLLQKPLPLSALLEPAIHHAQNGYVVTNGQAETTSSKQDELKDINGFSGIFLNNECSSFLEGEVLHQKALASSLNQLADAGLDDFYRGDLARTLASEFKAHGSPLRLNDLENFRAITVSPLRINLDCGQLYNMPPPTQGISSLMILGLFDNLKVQQAETFEHLHGLIEATKQAFIYRNQYICDPDYMDVDPGSWLTKKYLNDLSKNIDMHRASPWPYDAKQGDTVWMGCADSEGRVVSFIQSTYWEYGSGLVPKDTGIVWQNRGITFSLDPENINALVPGKRPFHTLNPALAKLKDGRTLAYGTMGGEGQPQTQAAIFSRYVMFGQSLQQAITAPRWLLGRTWGESSDTLKLENRFDPALVESLLKAGHDIEMLPPFTSAMGHTGAICLKQSGVIEGASDPRSDGCAVAL